MRADLPSGTVTFLFTDVEGSTRLLHSLGAEAYAEALAEHRSLIREACTSQGGVEVDTQGDAFFFAFPTAPGALAAASAFTQALASGPIQVRAGLHTGTPLLAEEGYVGDDVHRAARIAACGHGGQVLVSASTATLVGPSGSEPQALPLRDLGEHRFKDLSAPERVYQLGTDDFPPLKTLFRTNLPVPATPFLGREKELGDVLALLARDDVRLLTLTGPGGTGKTRLGAQAAAALAGHFPHGVWWVPLATLRNPELVLESAAQILGATDGLASHVADRRLLLLFDNFEQVVEAATGLASLLRECPNVELLVTSREPLRVSGEHTYPVPPFAPEEAVGFFAARARAVVPEFVPDECVIEICRRLDELPLALELASARVQALSTRQILDRLEERLPLLTGGSRDTPERQRTLRATIEWSYDLLSAQEQRLFRNLGVFVGGCMLEAAEEVIGADLDALQSLVAKSLLRVATERYWMLETIREYAGEQLESSDEAPSVRDRHLAWVAREAHARAVPARSHDADAHAFLHAEQANIREALGRAIQRSDADSAQLILSGTTFHWLTRGQAREGDEWAARVVAIPSEPAMLYAWSLVLAGEFPRFRGEPARARPLKEKAIEILEQLGDDPAVESRLAAAHSDLSDVLSQLGLFDIAFSHAERALAIRRLLGQPKGIAHAIDGVATVAERRGRLEEALALYEESFELSDQTGDPLGAGESLPAIGRLRLALGDVTGARAAAEEAFERASESGDAHIRAIAITVIGRVAFEQGDLQRAVALLARARVELEETGLLLEEADQVEEALDECRRRLGPAQFEEALAAGLAAAGARDS